MRVSLLVRLAVRPRERPRRVAAGAARRAKDFGYPAKPRSGAGNVLRRAACAAARLNLFLAPGLRGLAPTASSLGRCAARDHCCAVRRQATKTLQLGYNASQAFGSQSA